MHESALCEGGFQISFTFLLLSPSTGARFIPEGGKQTIYHFVYTPLASIY